MSPPEAVQAAYDLVGDAWPLQRHDDDRSSLLEAWERRLEEVAPDSLEDVAGWFAFYKQDFGLRAGLLLGAMVAARPDGSTLTTVDAARALLEAAAWLDASHDKAAYPQEPPPGGEDRPAYEPPKMTAEEEAGWATVRSSRRAVEAAVVGDAVAAATGLWRSLSGVDVDAATLDEMLDLDRMQQAATLEGRARLEPLLASGTCPQWVWEALAATRRRDSGGPRAESQP